jgi:hypothetical protein
MFWPSLKRIFREIPFRNKIPETPRSKNRCTGMKTVSYASLARNSESPLKFQTIYYKQNHRKKYPAAQQGVQTLESSYDPKIVFHFIYHGYPVVLGL